MNEDQRGAVLPAWQQAQSGQPPAVPSLLQMAQGLGPEWQSDPALNNGAPFRAITSPEDQNWSDLAGNPIHMGGPAPAYQPGTSLGGYASIFDARAPTDGGYFTMQDYNKGNTAQNTPATEGTNQLSTNNWRLLGDDPDKFMVNGQVISRRGIRDELAQKSVLGQEGGGPMGIYPAGGGQWRRPVSSQGQQQGYIGAAGGIYPNNWGYNSTPTY